MNLSRRVTAGLLLLAAAAFGVPAALAQTGGFENRTTFGNPTGPTPVAGGINAEAVAVNGTPVLTGGTPTPAPTCAAGIMLAGNGGQGIQCGPTLTPQPTTVPATPQPAPTLFPTVAAGVVLGGTGAQGVQAISNIPGTLTTAAQPNITSVGTLSSVATSGGVTVGNGALGLSTSSAALTMNGQNAARYLGSGVLRFNPLGSGQQIQFNNFADTQNNLVISDSGGLQMGAPTGGDKGTGTINVASGIYLNGTAYTNPDYVLERWATGRIARYAGKPGASAYQPLTLPQMEVYARTNLALPGFGQTADNDLFSGSDMLLARVEDGYRYLFDHEERLRALTAGEVGLGLLSMLLAGAFLVERRTLLRRIEALEAKA